MSAIESCRTAALGGHLYECDRCGQQHAAYNSCRNRHCPKCQGPERQRWLAARQSELLPVGYFHAVFTLPSQLGPLALRNQKTLYNLLFRAASRTLLEVAADPRHLGARIGFLAILHTWGQQLTHHPHLHVIVPGGGLSPERDRWIDSPADYLLPQQVLARVFRGKYLAGLKAAYEAGELKLVGRIAELAEPRVFAELLDTLYALDWVIYLKEPFAGPERVLSYLARYTYRVALSNRRLVRMEGDTVVLTYKDYRHQGRQRLLRLPAPELIRRFLQHVLPSGFVRIRYYGLFANRNRAESLALCRLLLGAASPDDTEQPEVQQERRCPTCGEGVLRLVGRLAPVPTLPSPTSRGPP